MQCPEDVLWRCPDEVSRGLVWPYPDVFQKACDVLAFTPTADMFGSQANHQVPRYFSVDDSDTEAAGTDVFILLGRGVGPVLLPTMDRNSPDVGENRGGRSHMHGGVP